MSNFLTNISVGGLKAFEVATFDRFALNDIESPLLRILVRLFGYAAKLIADKLQKKGGEAIAPPERFFVKETESPLKEGELERAADWAKQILATYKFL